ncbi:MAG: F0F1 ATP synthase subunit A [Aureispira sp.]|nr:F0F1 ATP synthase subunit A [Aureispira sp.]
MTQTAWAGDPQKGSDEPFNPTPHVMHHISDAHAFHVVGSFYIPLPCIAYSDDGVFFTFSSAFGARDEHGTFENAVDGYVIYHDELMKIKGEFPAGTVKVSGHATSGHDDHGHGDDHDHDHHGDDDHGHQTVDEHGVHGGDETHKEEAHAAHHIYKDGKSFEIEPASKIQGMTSWYDFSITKNVFTMLLGLLVLVLMFRSITKSYKTRKGEAPKGLQSVMEPVIVFMRDEVVAPAIGPKWEKFFPFVMTLFFFILINNIVGLIPFFPGSANVTGNIGVTIVLAVFTFLVVNLNGNKHYWEHIVWMPGVPAFVKIILTPIEILGIFIKPVTLLIRLFANISAGHIMILSLTSLIFVFSNVGESIGGAIGGGAIAVPFVFAMNFLELFVGFLQAFIFALLTSLYIGSAVEEHHHEEAH